MNHYHIELQLLYFNKNIQMRNKNTTVPKIVKKIGKNYIYIATDYFNKLPMERKYL